jgi:hypothetical protein
VVVDIDGLCGFLGPDDEPDDDEEDIRLDGAKYIFLFNRLLYILISYYQLLLHLMVHPNQLFLVEVIVI